MKYNKFTAMITPFINARGNSIMFPPESLETTVNVSVQQIYNEYRWTWLLEDETLTGLSVLGDNFSKELKYPVKYHLEAEQNGGTLNPVRSINDLSSGSYGVFDKTFIVADEGDCTITYLRDYNFLNYVSDSTQEIPLPDKLIPALYYLVLSQLDLIDVQQLAGQPANNFNKYQYEISNLKANDIGFESTLISGNAQ